MLFLLRAARHVYEPPGKHDRLTRKGAIRRPVAGVIIDAS